MNKPEPIPVENEHPAIWPLVIQDMQERHQTGIAKYGTPLQPHNGRRNLVDLYQELLDAAVYVRTEIYERYESTESGASDTYALMRQRDRLRAALEHIRDHARSTSPELTEKIAEEALRSCS